MLTHWQQDVVDALSTRGFRPTPGWVIVMDTTVIADGFGPERLYSLVGDDVWYTTGHKILVHGFEELIAVRVEDIYASRRKEPQ